MRAAVVAHADRLLQLLDKPLDNALVHGAPAQPIEIAAWFEADRRGMASATSGGKVRLAAGSRGDAFPVAP